MTEKTDDTGKGQSRPGDPPRRPYATIDLKATEVGSDGARATAPGAHKPEAATAALPPPGADQRGRGAAAALGGWAAALGGGLAAAVAWAFRLARSSTLASHAAAGVAGAALTLAVAAALGLLAARQPAVPSDLARRVAALEKALAQQPALPPAVTDRLAAADKRLSSLEEQAKAIAALKSEHAKLAAEARSLESRVAAPGAAERVARLEAAVAALSADAKAGDSTSTPEPLAPRLAEVEKVAGEARSAALGVERDLATLKGETADLRQRLQALKGSVEDRVLAKLAGLERDMQAIRNTEGERAANAQRVLLALEIANLKRALDRGDSYARELDAARKAAGGTIDLTPLDRSSATGVPTLGALTQDFRRVANAAMDAEAERPDASVLDRLMAGARSVIRLRKARYDADDTSVEATLGRMEAALKNGHIGEVLAQSKRLPPKAAHAAEGWLRQLEARYAADRTIAEIEAALKSSLAEQPLSGPEPKR